jgi:hypothetical protein
MQPAWGSVARWGWVLLATGMLSAVPVMAQEQPMPAHLPARLPAVPPLEQQLNAATLAQLEEPMQVVLADAPLNDVIEFLATLGKIQFYLDRGALEDAQISPETPITLDLNNISRGMALDLIFAQAKVAYYIRSGVIIVATPDALSKIVETVVYPVADLFDATKTRGEELAELIYTTVAPDSWDFAGGRGVIRTYRDTLVVSQNPNVHRRIERLLSDLRQAAKAGNKPADAADQPAGKPQ